MSAALQQSPRTSSWIQGVRTQLIREALATALNPEAENRVLFAAGWDSELDRPRDPRISPLEWVETRLFVRLADHMGIAAADELRAHVGSMLALVEARMQPPPDTRPPSPRVSGTARRRTKPGFQTVEENGTARPTESGRTVVMWTAATDIELLVGFAQTDIQLVSLRGVDELRAMLSLSCASASLWVLDVRESGAEELESLAQSGAGFDGRHVIVWGASSVPDALSSRAVSCTVVSHEAESTDIANLSASLLGAPRL